MVERGGGGRILSEHGCNRYRTKSHGIVLYSLVDLVHRPPNCRPGFL